MIATPSAAAPTPAAIAARQSVERIAALHPNVLATGHGVPLEGPAMRNGLRALSERFDAVMPSSGRYVPYPAITDAHGFYSLAYTYPGINPLLIWKDGYDNPPGQPPGTVRGSLSRQPMVNGDTKFDIELVRR